MTIFHYMPQNPRPHDWSLTKRGLYWTLRGFTFLIGLGLGLMIAAAFVAIPFYAAEGYSAQFEDRLLSVLSAFVLFISIIIPHRWTLRGSAFSFRVAIITFAIASTLAVDLIAFRRGLTTSPFTAAGGLALLAGTALLVTLQLERRRFHLPKPFASSSQALE